ncbi:Tripartite tricarboxylate transporter family receptor [Pigmentiphaga humi]|uniref:Tripartite tricarboxylate transporter family receptor n=1 Tax=Pigmentiphaga humi TaxID=2478468 RepID=A0A3P4AYH1_9BURK|nr:tripartite tricarboxylate transporter substrate binding protein [Pigmentiphaga humi]VCU68611.1 Tripartite tricarboxylate transporter family receptor [Pigmentiphaga humi]
MLTKLPINLLFSLALTTFIQQAAAAEIKPAPTFPVKQVEITVPYAVGGGVDMLARLIGEQLGKLGHPVIVDNKAGAGSTVGTRIVAGKPKDGHSLLMMNDAYSLAPAIYKNLGYDPKKDLEAVINVAYAPMLVVVPTTSKFKTLADLVAAGREAPGKLSYGSCGAGTDPHLAGEMMNIDFKMQNVHVPYKGCGPALVDTMGGQVDFAVVTISGALTYISGNKLRALAITSADRSKAVPEVPTIAESGAPGFNLSQWQGLAVPGGTPENIKMDVYKTISAIMKTDAMRKRLLDLGYTTADEGPAAFQKIVNEDIDRFATLAQKIGLRAD